MVVIGVVCGISYNFLWVSEEVGDCRFCIVRGDDDDLRFRMNGRWRELGGSGAGQMGMHDPCCAT